MTTNDLMTTKWHFIIRIWQFIYVYSDTHVILESSTSTLQIIRKKSHDLAPSCDDDVALVIFEGSFDVTGRERYVVTCLIITTRL